MPLNRNNDGGRLAASLLASTFVVIAGGLVCAFMIFTFSDHPEKDFLWLGGGVAGLGLLIWLLRDKPPNDVRTRNFFWFTRKKPAPYLPNYAPRKRRNPEKIPLGSNEPRSAENVRQLKEGANTWVPKSPPPRKPTDE